MVEVEAGDGHAVCSTNCMAPHRKAWTAVAFGRSSEQAGLPDKHGTTNFKCLEYHYTEN